MRVLLTGAYGFIGSAIASALLRAGHVVVPAVRRPRAGDDPVIACDMGRDVRPENWLPLLAGIDAVVNCAGILRERRGESFQAVHVDAPMALFEACMRLGVRRVVQVSALGNPVDAEFLASKHRCDAALAKLPLDWTVLRPSVVYSPMGAFGGTSMLRAMACLPGVLFVPGRGEQRIQPVDLADLAASVVACLASPASHRQVIEIAGPQVLTITDYLLSWRRWFGLEAPRLVQVPQWLTSAGCQVGEWLRLGPLGRTMQRMLDHDNVAALDVLPRMEAILGVRPAALGDALVARPCQVQDRLHAFTYFLYPLMLAAIVVIWLVSGVTGFVTPQDEVRAIFEKGGLPGALGPPLVWLVSLLDFALGVLVLVPRFAQVSLLLMLASVLGYTLLIGTLWSASWFDPFGGLLKNLALIPALLYLLAWNRQR